MSRAFAVREPLEMAYVRRSVLALEVLDAVNGERLSRGLKVVAEGLRGAPVISAGGLFVWLQEDLAALRRITVDPQQLPYDRGEVAPGEVQPPPKPTVLVLAPRLDYAFAAGVSGLFGSLVESRMLPPRPPTPVAGAAVRLQWLDEDGVTWRDAGTVSRTAANGDFVTILRLAAGEVPLLDAAGALAVRLRVERDGSERGSARLALPPGRVADPSTYEPGPAALLFAWDELQP